MTAFATVLQLGSHVALLPALALALLGRYPADFMAFLMIIIVSCTYHACLSGVGCVNDLDQLRIADHQTVWTGITLIALTGLQLPSGMILAYIILVVSVFRLLPFMLVGTLLFPVVLALFFAFIVFMRIFLEGMRLSRYDLFSICLGLIMFAIGVFFNYTSPSIHQENYDTRHPLWHFFSMLGILFVYAPLRGFHFDRSVAKAFRRWMRAEDDPLRGLSGEYQ